MNNRLVGLGYSVVLNGLQILRDEGVINQSLIREVMDKIYLATKMKREKLTLSLCPVCGRCEQ